MAVFITAATTFVNAQSKKDSINNIETVLVTDTKFAQSKEKSGKIIEKITSKDLENKKGQSIATILNQVAGLEINGNQSGTGKNIEYYIRGGRSRQVLIIIDGVPVTDASGIGLQYDLRLLPSEQIESIEVMKGAASTLYGSGASTGVINITLKKSVKKQIEGSAYFQLGTQNIASQNKTNPQEFNQGFSVNGTLGKFNYLTALNSTELKGISEATGTDFEEDRFSRVNIMQKLGFNFNEKLSVNAFVNYDKLKNTFDANNFTDDLLNNQISEQFRAGFTTKFVYHKGELLFNSGFSNLERTYFTFDTFGNSLDKSYYKSRTFTADLVNKYNFTNELYAVLGTQFQFLDMFEETKYENIYSDLAKFNNIDPYATLVYNSKFGFNVNAGARLNIHSVYGNYITWNINPSFSFKNTPLRIISSISIAYITPSLYQLFSPYGNLNLKPEENKTIEAGFETSFLNKKVSFNAVGFYREEFNKFDFLSTATPPYGNYINAIETVIARGFETTLALKPTDNVAINSNYTFTQVAELQSIKIPKHKVNVNLDVKISNKMALNTQYQYNDFRKDAYFDLTTFTTSNVVLKSYQLVHATLNFTVLPKTFTVFATVTNIFNADFVENIGYSTRGRNFKLGLNFKF